jgi:hypothetical protein
MNKEKKLSTKMSNMSDKWCQAIRDAEDEIRFLTRQRSRLERAVRIFRENKRDGVPWPGDGIIGQGR